MSIVGLVIAEAIRIALVLYALSIAHFAVEHAIDEKSAESITVVQSSLVSSNNVMLKRLVKVPR